MTTAAGNIRLKKRSKDSIKSSRMWNQHEGEIWYITEYSVVEDKEKRYYYLILEHQGHAEDEPLFRMLDLDTGEIALYYMNFDLDDWREA